MTIKALYLIIIDAHISMTNCINQVQSIVNDNSKPHPTVLITF